MNLGIPIPSRYASELYAASLIGGPGFSHRLGQLRTVANGRYREGYYRGSNYPANLAKGQDKSMVTLRFSVGTPGSPSHDDRIVLEDPFKTQEDPAVYACQVTMGAGSSRAIFGSSPLGALANAVTVASALVESQGQVTWLLLLMLASRGHHRNRPRSGLLRTAAFELLETTTSDLVQVSY